MPSKPYPLWKIYLIIKVLDLAQYNLKKIGLKSTEFVFTITIDNAITWLQYKLIYNILAAQSYLFNLKITDSSTYGICGNNVETIQHLFMQCTPVQELWFNVVKRIKEKINQNMCYVK